MEKLTWEHSIHEFLSQAASAQPTPGGGSVASLAAALASSMTSMAARLSQGDKYTEHLSQTDEAVGLLEQLTGTCEQLMQADIAAFDGYMQAIRLSKTTDEEKQARRQAIDAAAAKAIEVPLQLARLCRDGMRCTRSLAGICNPHVISDLGIGAILFEAAAQSAGLTVEINLASIRDSAQKAQYAEDLAALIHEITDLRSEALAVTRSRIGS
ncbi:cyclodeaminase/cyclohydrolase family protein [Paenibacillus daejeonensis]|uniref:cyclodeaminase/cyclohydrolase family protein n=1 Tax=Paenibacillus daejeonensis TaxID=135193 RepID=UPI000364EA44|nr:cyclodeaminase/cyclohydrolase family protein [Paenibacillus daejeonensis]